MMKSKKLPSFIDYHVSAKQWVLLLAPLAAALLIVILLFSRDGNPPFILESPHPVHASIAGMEPGHDHAPMDAMSADQGAHDPGTRYACPMMCVPPTDQPGNCPVCGMALTAVARPESASQNPAPRLQLSAEAVHLAEIRTAPATRMAVTNEVRLFGRIDFDSAHTTEITAFMPGVIDRVYIKRAGQFVRWGDPLFDIYSSDLLDTQRQLVEAMRYVPSFLAFQANTPHVAQDVPIQVRKKRVAGSGNRAVRTEALQKIKALRHKLSILGLPKRDIDQFMKKGEATGIATVYAPMYGQITVQKATEGTFVNTGTSLFTIADPKYVWARLDAYESDYPWIRIGQRVTFTTEAYPGEVFEAKVVYIDPVFNPATRTFSVGAITTRDQGGRLKAGMLTRAVAHARIDAGGNIPGPAAPMRQPPLVIPASAPLITGKRAVVYVAVAEERHVFEGREVVLGPRTTDHYVVREGLVEGERVVVNGNFKIDSAMQISARPSLMSASGGKGGARHDHTGHPAARMPAHDAAPGQRTDHAAVSGGMDEREYSLADDHQHPDLSGQMHDHYMDQRRSSRMPAAAGPEMDEHRPASAGYLGHGGTMQSANRLIRRRKPGQYGDTSRQGASGLEEHHKRWRRQPGETIP